MDSRKHRGNHHGCVICGYGTRSLSDILKHVRQQRRKLQGYPNGFTCHSNVPDIYKCGSCDFETNLKVSLTYHKNINHKNLENQNRFRYVLRQCGHCDLQTYSTLLLLKHCLICDRRKNLEAYVNCTNWLECGQCPYKTKDKYYLRRHIMRMHKTNIQTNSVNIVWYHCGKCEYKTKVKGNLKTHKTGIHTDSANIVWHHCDKCEFKTKWKGVLRRHITNIHTDSANIVWRHCDKCNLKTKWKGDLRRHIARIHMELPGKSSAKCRTKYT